MTANDLIDRYYELRQHLGIDLLDLEHAFMVTPRVIQDAAELAAKADNVKNVAKHTLDIVKAEAGERIRSPARPGGRDLSEARVAAVLPLDPQVQEARRLYDNATYEADLCTALHQSLRDQSFLLSKTAEMVIAGFISPTTAHEHRREEIVAARAAAAGVRASQDNRGKGLARPT